MTSLKKIFRMSLAVIAVFICFSLYINFYFVPEAQDYMSRLEDHLDVMSVGRLEMDLPIRVMDNVLTQVKGKSQEEISDKLVAAYDEKRDILLANTQLLLDDLTAFEADVNRVDSLSMNIHSEVSGQLKDQLEEATYSVQRINTLIQGSTIMGTPIDEISTHYETLGNQIDLIRGSVKTYKGSFTKDIGNIIRVIFFVFLAFIFMSGYILTRIVRGDLSYILKVFSNIERHEYDTKLLPDASPRFEEEFRIVNYVEKMMNEQHFSTQVKEVLMTHYIVEDVIEKLFEIVEKQIGVDRVGIAFVDYESQKFIAEYGVLNYGKVLLGPGFEIGFDRTTLKSVIEDKRARITPNLEEELAKRPKSPALRLLHEEGIHSNMILPMTMGEAVFGIVFFSSKEANYFTEDHLRIAEKIIYEISGLLNRAYFTKVIFSKITNSFSELVENKDAETGDHVKRMVRYSVAIAEGVRKAEHPDYLVNRRFVLEIERNASAHDIGKVGIPDAILKKPGKLGPSEWEVMKTHTTIGAGIFTELREGLRVFDPEFYRFAEEIARSHHERWDGTGYPDGLVGMDIPLSARIVALADVFDALTSPRVYKAAYSFESSVEMIKESAGTHLDPFLVDIFIDHLDEIWEIYNHSNHNI